MVVNVSLDQECNPTSKLCLGGYICTKQIQKTKNAKIQASLRIFYVIVGHTIFNKFTLSQQKSEIISNRLWPPFFRSLMFCLLNSGVILCITRPKYGLIYFYF